MTPIVAPGSAPPRPEPEVVSPHGNDLLRLFAADPVSPGPCAGSGKMGIVVLTQWGGGIIDDPEVERADAPPLE